MVDKALQKVRFTTKRPFEADDPIHQAIKLDSEFALSIATGKTSETEWSERIENGKIDLFFNSQTQRIEDSVEEIIVEQEEVVNFSKARIPAYE